MLLLKPIHNINNTLRFLTSLLARIVASNKFARTGLLFILFASLTNKGFAQQDCSIPYTVDLTASPNVSYTEPGVVRQGDCDGGHNCVSYRVLINPGTDILAITSTQFANSDNYYLDGDGPYPVTQSACVAGKTSVLITFCKPGSNKIDITFSALGGVSVSPDISLRPGCTGTMTVTGMITSTIKWTSIYPGTTGAYDSYLSATSGASTVTVAPTAAAPGGYIQYQVTGTEQSPCNTLTRTATIKVYTYPALTVSLSPSATTVCSGNPVTITANASGGYPPYTYSWSYNGSTSSSITVNSAGTYTVSVSDQLSNCGPVFASTTLNAATPVGPTAASQTICNGNTATLTATAPGGPYQWYDPTGALVGTGASYTTPTLTTGTYTYKVMTSFGGCPSTTTPVTVTVLPVTATPTASPVTICNGNTATLTATAPGGPYQWYDPAGAPVATGASYTTPPLTAGTYNYTVISSNSGCPGQPATVTVTVLPTPAGPTAPSQTICNNTAATLTASGAVGTTYQWFNSAGTLVGSGASYTTPTLTTGTYNYTVVATVGGCPSTPTPVTVTVLPTPAGPTAPSQTICNNTATTLTASGSAGATYQWFNSAGTLAGSGASYTTPTLTTGTYNYTVVATVGGCSSTPTPVTVTVLPTPPPPTVFPATICNGFTATLTATAPGGPYQWYDSTGTVVGTGTSYTTPVLTTGATNTVYTYTVTDTSNGCPSSSTSVSVTVTPTPPTPIVQSQ